MFDKAIPQNASPEPPPQRPALVVPARSPAVTYTLMALNILVFAAMGLRGVSWTDPDPQSMLDWGADYGPATLHGQPWRIVSSMFLHFGILHIGMNMYVLYQIGPFTERLFGHLRYAFVYMLAGIGGSLLSLRIHPNTLSAGASGAIFGVYGGLMAFMFAHRSVIPAASLRQIVRSAVVFLGFNFIYGLKSSVDLSAHIGGLLSGFLLGLALAPRRVDTPAAPDAVQ